MCQRDRPRRKEGKEFWHGALSELSGQILSASSAAIVSKIETRQLTATHGGQAPPTISRFDNCEAAPTAIAVAPSFSHGGFVRIS
jgi:hypothetical protein